MSEKKHIDRVFQEKFKDFEVAPNAAMWNRIEKDIPRKRKRRRVVALWWRLGGVAAILLLMLTVGVSIFGPEESTNEDFPIVNEDINNSNLNNSIEGKETNSPETNDVIVNTKDSSIAGTKTNDTNSKNYNEKTSIAKFASKSNEEENFQKSVSKNKNMIANNSKIIQNPTTQNEPLEELIKDVKPDEKNVVAEKESNPNTSDLKELDKIDITEDTKVASIEEAIAEQEELTNEKEKAHKNRWSVYPNVAPVYFSSIGQGSPVNEQFNENSKGSNVSMSYGVSGSYALSNRIKVRVGVNSVNLNQTTANVFAFNDVNAEAASRMANIENVQYKQNSNSYTIMSSTMMNRVSSPELFNSKIAGELEQRFGFIEVPLELEYSVIDKRFGFNVIGGFSTLFLNNNELYADIDGNSTLIGEATNINSTSFSANLGLGMDYSLSKQWNINLEPMFKYQINTFNNTSGNFRPFFIGVYSGLSFKF